MFSSLVSLVSNRRWCSLAPSSVHLSLVSVSIVVYEAQPETKARAFGFAFVHDTQRPAKIAHDVPCSLQRSARISVRQFKIRDVEENGRHVERKTKTGRKGLDMSSACCGPIQLAAHLKYSEVRRVYARGMELMTGRFDAHVDIDPRSMAHSI